MTPRPVDEAPHAPESQPGWSDAWQLDAANADGVGLTLRLDCYPNEKVAWFWTYLVVPDRDGPIVVRDHEVSLPRQGLEIRAEGLWADLWCETPLEHWTYGLEAFAVALDSADDALTGEIGERIPVGLDIEWETDGPIQAAPEDWPVDQYLAPGIIHGDVLLGRERFELDARGLYTRSWGGRNWYDTGAWSIVCHSEELTLHVEGCADGRVDGSIRRARRQPGADHARRVARSATPRCAWSSTTRSRSRSRCSRVHRCPSPRRPCSTARSVGCRSRTPAASGLTANGWSSVLEAR